MIQALKLTQPVTVSGKNFWGRESQLRLTPIAGANWQWRPVPSKTIALVAPYLLNIDKRRVSLSMNGRRLEVFEHIGVLRYFGVQGVELHSTTAWPPYHGRAFELWEATREAFLPTKEEMPYYTVKEAVRWEYPGQRGEYLGFTCIIPLYRPGLMIDVLVDYPGIGKWFERFQIRTARDVWNLSQSYALGWPSSLYYLSRTAGWLGWPHHKNVLWKQEWDAQKILPQIVAHRAQDILGIMSTLCKDGLFAGHVISHYSGHEADFHAARRAYPLLTRV